MAWPGIHCLPSSSTLSTKFISAANRPILMKFHMKHHWAGGKGSIMFLDRSDWNSGENLVISLAASMFFQIAFILADNEDRYKISVMFHFGLNGIVHSRFRSPWALESLAIDLTWGKCCHHNSDFSFFRLASILPVTSRGKKSGLSSIMSRIGSFH